MKNTILVEFNGLPGCGKTTICKLVRKKIESSGYSVYFLQDSIAFYSKHKLLIPIVLIYETILFGPRSIKKYYDIYKTLSPNSKKIVFASFKNYVLARRSCRFSKNKYVISDQCIVQNILSCYHDKEIKNTDVIKRLLDCAVMDFKKIICIDVDIDTQTTKCRIIDRKSNSGRIDKLEESQIYQILKIQKDNICKIRETGDGLVHIRINSDESPEYCSNEIIGVLLNMDK